MGSKAIGKERDLEFLASTWITEELHFAARILAEKISGCLNL